MSIQSDNQFFVRALHHMAQDNAESFDTGDPTHKLSDRYNTGWDSSRVSPLVVESACTDLIFSQGISYLTLTSVSPSP